MNQIEKDKIKDANDIVEVIGEYVTLKKRGVNYVGICPFHGDAHPSMFVNPAKQIYKCFACGAGGDVVEFVSQYEKVSFMEAMAILAKRANIEFQVKEMTPEEATHMQLLESLRIVTGAAADYYQSQLSTAAGYLGSRGFDLTNEKDVETLKLYGVGYAPANNALKKHMAANGYKHQYLVDTDLLKQGDRGTFDAFRERLIFPFYDRNGRVCGFTGRLLDKDAKAVKYLNTGDTPIYKKGEQVWGLYQARNEISRAGYVYLVEGQMDVLSLARYGVKNVIAGSGCAFTPEQLHRVSRFAGKIALAYDADKAGLEASYTNAMQMLRAGLSIQCVLLPAGKDPDNFAQLHKDKVSDKLEDCTLDFVTYFFRTMMPKKANPEKEEEILNKIIELIGQIDSSTLRAKYCQNLAKLAKTDSEEIVKRASKINKGLPAPPSADEITDAIIGDDELDKFPDLADMGCRVTPDYDAFFDLYSFKPVVLVKGTPTNTAVQAFMKHCNAVNADAEYIQLSVNGEESPFMATMAAFVRAGIEVSVTNCTEEWDRALGISNDLMEQTADELGELMEKTKATKKMPSLIDTDTFTNFYVFRYSMYLNSIGHTRDTAVYIERCAELISYLPDATRLISLDKYKAWLDVNKSTLTSIIKPYLDRRKSRIAVSAQTQDDLLPDEIDSDELPLYVRENDEYMQMWKECYYYPRVNKQGIPVSYIFQENNQKRQVGDFYMEPLIHVYSDNDEDNKRIIKINRRYYTKPLYVELPSKSLTKKSSLEEKLIMLEAVNFSNAEEKHWTKIREFMSRRYAFCTEVMTYGNQQLKGNSYKEDEQFFAFSNGIFHQVEGRYVFEPVNELGIVQHNKKNYYLPAFSTIYSGNKSDKYEVISQLVYYDIPAESQVSFEEWATLMDKVYKINDNGKWALIFALMCAFRSNIHWMDRLFTAPFFMGPMSSGKTQIAISIRSLFISPKIPIFNLNIGTDAALSTLMGTFRDVPVVLDEYNNNDISDIKFQSLKGIVYDGDGRQKRKGTSSKEIENDKVFTPVILCGQETPQRDDNALMSRIIVCEVPKPSGARTAEEVELFDKLKEIEDPDRVGLSNVLLQVLQLRPLFMKHFHSLKRECYNELKKAMVNIGEVDRLMKTASLFLATCKLIERYTELHLPFTYADFFHIAIDKIKFQMELISKTDKLAVFFKAMDVMIDTKAIIEGRDFSIETPERITILLPGKEKKEVPTSGMQIMFLRVSNVFTQFSRSSYNRENSTQSTIEQNLRSHPSYIGSVQGKRFAWNEVEEVPNGEFKAAPPTNAAEQSTSNALGVPDVSTDNRVTKRSVQKSANTSCIALNYTTFKELYNIDLQRSSGSDAGDAASDSPEQPLPF